MRWVLFLHPGQPYIQVMESTLHELQPSLDAVEACIHDRAEVNVKADIGADADDHGSESEDFSQRHEALFFRPRPPARPALRAISLRCSGLSFLIRARAPRFPSATAAAFFRFAMR